MENKNTKKECDIIKDLFDLENHLNRKEIFWNSYNEIMKIIEEKRNSMYSLVENFKEKQSEYFFNDTTNELPPPNQIDLEVVSFFDFLILGITESSPFNDDFLS